MRKHLLLFVFIVLAVSAEEMLPAATLLMPMRDGKEIPCDIYLPSPDARHIPFILVRSPAGRKAIPALANLKLLSAGFGVAITDTRSSIDLEGKTMPCIDDGWGHLQDGYDTIEWLSKTEYSNGSIGTAGTSALGIVQLMVAPLQPKALKAQFIQFACGSIYHHAAYPGGQLQKHLIESWLNYYAKDPSTVSRVKREKTYGPFWSKYNTLVKAPEVRVPAVFIAGWFDTFLQGTIDAFKARQERGGPGAKGTQKIIIGPWSHFWPLDDHMGSFPIPEAGKTFPVDLSPKRWFNHYLKGEDNGVENEPVVHYFVMGPFDGSPSKGNVWKTAPSWPPKSKPYNLFLGESNFLTPLVSEADKKYPYSYDPENPMPTLGGRNLFLPSGPFDQSELEKRGDQIIFTSQTLDKDIEITGAIEAKIFLSTNKEDTDLAVKLTDVYPDGKSYLVADQLIRLGNFENDLKKPHEYTLNLQSISMIFAKGHKIRVSITSSNYPRFEKNLSITENDPVKTVNTLYTGKTHPSRIILPRAD